MRAALLVVLLFGVAFVIAPAHAAVSPFWQELSGSASGNGISQTPAPMSVFDTSVAVDADGRPVVVYAEFPDETATQGPIIVRRWNGSAFETLSVSVGIGYLPQIRLAPTGEIFVAWLQDDLAGNTEIHLRQFDGTSFVELGGSDSPGGISGTSPGITFPFSLAVDSNGFPVVAFLAEAQSGTTDVTPTPAIIQDTLQVYVRRWNGTAWEFLGSDFTGAGASNAVSFDSATDGTVLHSAETPTLTIDSTGAPVVAFAYVTEAGGELVDNTDIYVTRWNGTAWVNVGPAVPAADSVAGRGGAGGVSNSDTSSFNPSIAAGPAGHLALAWEETSPDATALYVWVRVWNGTSWIELAGSASDSGFTQPFTHNGVPQIAVGPTAHPVVAWNALTPASPAAQIFVMRWNGAAWVETALQSAGNAGISDAVVEAFAPALALTPVGGTGAAGAPTVAWLDSRGPVDSAQVFLRQLSTGLVTLSVAVPTGGGRITSNIGGVDCREACDVEFVPGTAVILTATKDTGGTFLGWGGACTSRGTLTTCPLSLNASTTVTASFKQFRVTVGVATPTGMVGQDTLGTVTGEGVSCAADNVGTCFADAAGGARVIFQAAPQPGNRFLSWSGGPCAGRTNATCDFVVTANTSTVALFRGVTGVRVLKAGNGSGTVAGTGIACGADCFEEMFSGTTVTLTPTATAGSTFRGWSGDVCDGKATGACTFVVAGNRSLTVLNQSVTATFQLNILKLAITQRMNGTVVSDPLPAPSGTLDCGSSTSTCQGLYDFGTPVVLRATADPGAVFTTWTGVTCAVGGATNASCAFKLTANTTATPNFRPRTVVTVVKSGNGAGTVSGPGISCGADCSEPEFDARLITLTAAPATGSRFAGWGDTCAFRGMNTSCAFVPAGANQSVTAAFELLRLNLIITSKLNGSVVNVVPLPGAITYDCGSDAGNCTGTFDYGTPVTLRALPNPGFVFANWTGVTCLLGGATNASCAFQLKANTTATPNYRPRTVVTVVKDGNGAGTVTGPGIACGVDCSEAEFDGKLITLTGTPAVGSHVAGFSGGCTSATAACAFVPSGANQTVTTTFILNRHSLTVAQRLNGSVINVLSLPDAVMYDCGSDGGNCTGVFDYSTPVVLRALPNPGFVFTSWTGVTCVPGGATNASCAFQLKANTTATPNYRPRTVVTVVKNGNGTGTVATTPGGISCGADCSEPFFDGKMVTLTATTVVGSVFSGFTGDCVSNMSVCTFLPTGDSRNVAATFSLAPITVKVQINGPGTVTGFGAGPCSAPGCSMIVDYGTPVSFQLLATPSTSPTGEFVSWSGCTPATTNASCTLTSTGVKVNQTVTATFRPTVDSVSIVPLAIAADTPIVKGARRQFSAIARFSDGTEQNVTTLATWASNKSAVLTITPTSGLATGIAAGNASVSVQYSTLTSSATALLNVEVDTLLPGSLNVSCAPYGDQIDAPGVNLSCLPGGLGFEVECQATAAFAASVSSLRDVTDQVTWVTTSGGVAASLGLASLNGSVRQSFQIRSPGTSTLYAMANTVTSPMDQIVQSVAATVTNISVTATPNPIVQGQALDIPLGQTAQLTATATLSSSTSGCTSMPPRDFSLRTTWTTVPASSPVADVSITGLVEPLAPGDVTIHWRYSGTTIFEGDVPITVGP